MFLRSALARSASPSGRVSQPSALFHIYEIGIVPSAILLLCASGDDRKRFGFVHATGAAVLVAIAWPVVVPMYAFNRLTHRQDSKNAV
jgi:hypothetical protein